MNKTQELTKRLEQELEQYKLEVYRLRHIVDNLPGSVYWKSRDGIYLSINQSSIESMRNMGFLCQAQDIIGKTDYDLFPKEIADQFRNHDLQVIESGQTSIREEIVSLKDKTFIQLSIKAPFFDKKGAIEGIIGNIIDITYLKQIEAELKTAKENAELANQLKTDFIKELENHYKIPLSNLSNIVDNLYEKETESSKKEFLLSIINVFKGLVEINHSDKDKEIYRLKNVLENLPGSIYWKDQHGVYLGVNCFSTEKMRSINLSWQDIVGKTDYDLFPKEVADAYRQNDLEIMTTGYESSLEETVTLPTGENLIQLSSKRPLRDEQGNIVGIIGNTVDITHLKKVEAELREAKEKAEVANQLKTAFIRDMEHDIRTPFSGIYSITKYLYEQETELTKKEFLGHLARAAKELLDYCNAILDFSRIESGILPLIEKKFDLHKLLDSVMAIEKPAAQFKKLELLFERSSDLPQIVLGDQYRLHRILINLLSNSIKFTKKGFIKLMVKLQKLDNKQAVISFIIEDTGIGIPPHQQDAIFEKFTRVIPANKNLYKGNGLGLKAVKQFIEELEGEIELTSELDKGSIFICTLPFKLPLIPEIADFNTLSLRRA